MKYSDIKRHLAPYSIHGRRKTTINHAFASSIAPCDVYSDALARAAVVKLGQDPNAHLECVFCGREAETWDHVFATVKDSEFSGAGHRLGNLLPCCKHCNSKKGNKDWATYIDGLAMPDSDKARRKQGISSYLAEYYRKDELPSDLPEYGELLTLRDQIIRIMQDADALAKSIRDKMANQQVQPISKETGSD
jgi:hypothetical protein